MKRFDPHATPLLFHGTIEPLEGPLRPGGYDGLFWTAESSTVAQNYIPATGGSVLVGVRSFELDEHVRPSRRSALYALAKTIGPAADDVQWDTFGSAKSWRIPEGCLTHRDVANHIEQVLGYKNRFGGNERMYELLTDGWDKDTQEHCVVSADFKRVGSLVIVEDFQSMRFLDLSLGESDLTALQYHKHEAFRGAREQGYDGIVIDDFAQSKTWGNVGHRSIGFFEHALAKVRSTVIPAQRFDWGESTQDLDVRDTPEFIAWQRARVAQTAAREPTRSLALTL